MARLDFDLLVVGGGSGGVRAARVAAGLGARVGLIEKAKLGGTCVNAGCIPKKLLYCGAETAQAFHDATPYAEGLGRARVDWSRLVARTDREVLRLNGVYRALLERAGVIVLEGEARVVEPTEIRIGRRRLRSRYLIIATGGAPRVPKVDGRELAITSDQAFHLDRLPRRIVIAGAGYVALEFASIFRRLGVEVQIVYRAAEILSGFDDDARRHLAGELRKQGIGLRPGQQVRALRRHGARLRVELTSGGELDTECFMFAVGRVPTTTGLGLDRIGVALGDDGRVLVDEHNRSSVEGIFAIGDCTGGLGLTPLAIAEGQAVARALFGAPEPLIDRDLVPTAVFCQPQLAKVGLSETTARERGLEPELYRSVFVPLEHRLSGRDELALVKLVVDRDTQRVLGCHVVAPHAAEIIQGFAVALRCGATKAQLDRTLGVHPTVAEELVTMPQPAAAAK